MPYRMPLLKDRSSEGQKLFSRVVGLSTPFHSLQAGAQRCLSATDACFWGIGDPQLCAYCCTLASAISDFREAISRKSARNAGKISFRPKGAQSRREPRQSASVVADPA